MTAPIMKPPPIRRLTIAVGKIMNAAITRKLSNIKTSAPSNTNPSITPVMTPRDPRNATHGRYMLQVVKNADDASATPFMIIRAAAMQTSTMGTHCDLKRLNAGNGPYQPGFAAPGYAATMPGAIWGGGMVWKQLGHMVSAP
jgi:hypothetical protein